MKRIGLRLRPDPMVEKAMESMPKAKALLDQVKRVIVQRLSK
jgi:hypothetical protein